MTKILQQLFFAAIISICASLTAFAQKDNGDKNKTPPKPPPPVVVVKPKEPEKPKDDKKDGDKSKKPQASIDGALQLVKIIFD